MNPPANDHCLQNLSPLCLHQLNLPKLVFLNFKQLLLLLVYLPTLRLEYLGIPLTFLHCLLTLTGPCQLFMVDVTHEPLAIGLILVPDLYHLQISVYKLRRVVSLLRSQHGYFHLGPESRGVTQELSHLVFIS